MGFGTLFIGYFLILDILYYHFTDIIAAAIMMLGLYKLASVSHHFKRAMYMSIIFSVFSLGELVFGAIDLFVFSDLSTVITVIATVRAAILAVYTLLILDAMHDISKELEVEKVPLRARTLRVWTLIVYTLYILLQTPILTSLVPVEVGAFLYLGTMIGLIILAVSVLTVIYTCYMRICMPEDLEPKKEKPSRFEFINEYRRRRDARHREEAEERMRREEERRRRRKK